MRPIRMSTLPVPIAIAALSIGLVVKQQRAARREARTTESRSDSSRSRQIEAVFRRFRQHRTYRETGVTILRRLMPAPKRPARVPP